MEEKVSLPIKTKIAAWWMILFGVISLVAFLLESIFFGILPIGDGGAYLIFLPAWTVFFSNEFGLLPGLFLLRRKIWALRFAPISIVIWLIISIVIIFKAGVAIFKDRIEMFILLFSPFLILIMMNLVPFILLLLDRKNFWKVAK
jgi:hypothetical protein